MENYDQGNAPEDVAYVGQEEAIVRALRQAQARSAQTNSMMPSNRVANPFDYLAQYLRDRSNDSELSAAEQKAAEMNRLKSTRTNDLVTQLSTPGTKSVFEKTLNGTGPLLYENLPEVEKQSPLSPEEENQRQMGLALKLGQINPQMAQPFITSGAAFPEKMAQMRSQQEAVQERDRQRAEDQRLMKEGQYAQQESMARLAAGLRPVPQAKMMVIDTIDDKGNAVKKVINASDSLGQTFPVAPKPLDAKQELAKQKGTDAAHAMLKQLDNIERNIDKLVDPIAKTAMPGLDKYVGPTNQHYPMEIASNPTVEAGSAYDSLRDQVMLQNLAEGKKAVEQSFGSMQLKEWDKFVNQATSLNRGNTTAGNVDSILYLKKNLNDTRAEIMKKLNGGADASNAQEIPANTAEEWLAKNPNHPNAAKVRAKLGVR